MTIAISEMATSLVSQQNVFVQAYICAKLLHFTLVTLGKSYRELRVAFAKHWCSYNLRLLRRPVWSCNIKKAGFGALLLIKCFRNRSNLIANREQCRLANLHNTNLSARLLICIYLCAYKKDTYLYICKIIQKQDVRVLRHSSIIIISFARHLRSGLSR